MKMKTPHINIVCHHKIQASAQYSFILTNYMWLICWMFTLHPQGVPHHHARGGRQLRPGEVSRLRHPSTHHSTSVTISSHRRHQHQPPQTTPPTRQRGGCAWCPARLPLPVATSAAPPLTMHTAYIAQRLDGSSQPRPRAPRLLLDQWIHNRNRI